MSWRDKDEPPLLTSVCNFWSRSSWRPCKSKRSEFTFSQGGLTTRHEWQNYIFPCRHKQDWFMMIRVDPALGDKNRSFPSCPKSSGSAGLAGQFQNGPNSTQFLANSQWALTMCTMGAKTGGPRTRWCRFKASTCLLAVWLGENYLIDLCFGFFIYKMGIKLIWEGNVSQLICNSSSIIWDRERGEKNDLVHSACKLANPTHNLLAKRQERVLVYKMVLVGYTWST